MTAAVLGVTAAVLGVTAAVLGVTAAVVRGVTAAVGDPATRRARRDDALALRTLRL